MIKFFKDGFPKPNKLDIDINNYSADNLLQHFSNSNIQILCGQVQSGKTNYIIEVAEKALNNYKFDYVIIVGGTLDLLLQQFIKRIEKKIKNFTIFNDFNYDCDKGIYVCLKEQTNFKKMFEFIKNNCDKKILLIDDECDYGSINTKEYNNPSSLNKYIYDAYDELDKPNFLFVTATPYANILNNKNGFGKQPNYLWTLPINEEYTGLEFFNKFNNFYIVPKYNEPYKLYEYSICLWLIQTFRFFNLKNNLFSDFLIYVDDLTDEHKTIKETIRNILNNFNVDKIKIRKYIIEIKEELNINDINEDDLIKFFTENFRNIKNNIYLFNKLEDNNDINRIKESNYNLKIIIGGRYLSRGITYENLLTELFLYCPQNNASVDTLLQRCRWFGYRKKDDRFKYMNVITKADIKNKFINELNLFIEFISEHPKGCVYDCKNLKEELIKLDQKSYSLKGTSYAKK